MLCPLFAEELPSVINIKSVRTSCIFFEIKDGARQHTSYCSVGVDSNPWSSRCLHFTTWCFEYSYSSSFSFLIFRLSIPSSFLFFSPPSFFTLYFSFFFFQAFHSLFFISFLLSVFLPFLSSFLPSFLLPFFPSCHPSLFFSKCVSWRGLYVQGIVYPS